MQRAKRRLAAVMCADVAHYSQMMERDEDGTLDRLKSYRAIMSGLTERHQGRIVNTWGDAVIIEFSSVVEAVQCAVDIQTELSQRNSELLTVERMDFRIGINLGDIIVEGDDIYGDGVNIAARLQEIAPTGGIMLSQSVYDQVRSKLAMGFDSAGLQTVKNVSEPVATYRVRLDGRNDVQETADVETGNTWHTRHHGLESDTHAVASGFEQARSWMRRQPRRIRSCVMFIFGFFLLNLMTSGLSSLWFIWPSLPFALALFWHLVFGAGRAVAPDQPGSRE